MKVSDVLRDLPQAVRTLADAEVDRALLVNGILADPVRVRLVACGLNEGAVVVCRDQGPERCVVQLLDGRCLRLPRAWARCIRVEPAGMAAPTPG